MTDEPLTGLPALFAGVSVADYEAAHDWYARLFGSAPTFHPDGVRKVVYRDPEGNEIGFGGETSGA